MSHYDCFLIIINLFNLLFFIKKSSWNTICSSFGAVTKLEILNVVKFINVDILRGKSLCEFMNSIFKSVSNSLEARNSNKEDNFKLNQRSRCLSIGAVSKIDHAIKEVEDEN